MARGFRGSETINVDRKGRLSVPAKFRRVFEASDPDFKPGLRAQLVIVYGDDKQRHLELYTIKAIDEIDAQIEQMQRGSFERRALERLMHAQSTEAEIDDDGRLTLPQKIRDKIDLGDQAFVSASGDYLNLLRPEDQEVIDGELDRFTDELPVGTDLRSFLPSLPTAKEDD